MKKPCKVINYCAAALLLICSVLPKTKAQNYEKKALEKINVLENLVKKAEGKSIYTEKERMTLRTAEIYLDYARWDEANVEINEELYGMLPSFKENARELAEGLAEYERKEVNRILEEAIENLEKLVSGEHSRKNSVEVDWSKAELSGNRILQDGRPVFLIDHFWKPSSDYLRYFGMADGIYFSPRQVLNDSGEMDPGLVERLIKKPDGSLGFIWVDNNHMPEWALQKYDNFEKGAGVFGKYDIDHPGARELYGHLFNGTIPLMKGKNYTRLGYMMHNEPSYFTQAGVWNSREVSAYTMEKFNTWIREKHGKVTHLNALWGTNFESLDDVSVTIPMDSSLQGTPLWYDWMTFNNYRVTEWFRFMDSQIKIHDPDARTHIKLMPWLWTQEKRDHGMDFESLLRLTDIVGCDAMAWYSKMKDDHEDWMDDYAFMWEEISMMFDFFRSVRPNQIIFDSETHILSSVHHREPDLNTDFVRATYWLAHMHGLNASNNWIWGRGPSGKPAMSLGKDYPGTNAQQPAVLNELHSTMIDLNSYSEEITAIQLQRKPIRIWYSLANAISSKDYMKKSVFETYESLYFEGIPLGFATDSILITEDTSDWVAILIRETEIVTMQEFNSLQAYLDAGGTVIMDAISFRKDEYGNTHTKIREGSGTLIIAGTLSEMNAKAMELIADRGLSPEVRVSETNSVGSKACTWRCIENQDGKTILSMVNLGKSEATLRIELLAAKNGIVCRDLLTGSLVPAETVLSPMAVLFLEVTEVEKTK